MKDSSTNFDRANNVIYVRRYKMSLGATRWRYYLGILFNFLLYLHIRTIVLMTFIGMVLRRTYFYYLTVWTQD